MNPSAIRRKNFGNIGITHHIPRVWSSCGQPLDDSPSGLDDTEQHRRYTQHIGRRPRIIHKPATVQHGSPAGQQRACPQRQQHLLLLLVNIYWILFRRSPWGRTADATPDSAYRSSAVALLEYLSRCCSTLYGWSSERRGGGDDPGALFGELKGFDGRGDHDGRLRLEISVGA